jgi:hypothetical protein
MTKKGTSLTVNLRERERQTRQTEREREREREDCSAPYLSGPMDQFQMGKKSFTHALSLQNKPPKILGALLHLCRLKYVIETHNFHTSPSYICTPYVYICVCEKIVVLFYCSMCVCHVYIVWCAGGGGLCGCPSSCVSFGLDKNRISCVVFFWRENSMSLSNVCVCVCVLSLTFPIISICDFFFVVFRMVLYELPPFCCFRVVFVLSNR